MNRRPFCSHALLCLATVAIASALAGCAVTETQLETPDSESSDTRSSAVDKIEGSEDFPARTGSIDPWVSCYSAFRPGFDPTSDLARLAAACATPAGLTALTPVYNGEPQTEDTPAERLTFLGRAGRCYRVFSIGAPSVSDLDIAILDAEGQIAAADASIDRFPIVPTRGPLCLRKDELFTIHAAVMQGSGGYLMQVWGNSLNR
jgi:hypothetical protein